MSIYALSKRGFQSLLRLATSSVAEPAWFAPPVEVEEDERSMTVVFHVAEGGKVRVDGSDQRVIVRLGTRRRGATRVCALPFPIVPKDIETTRTGELLRVRIPKKPAADAPETSSSSA